MTDSFLLLYCAVLPVVLSPLFGSFGSVDSWDLHNRWMEWVRKNTQSHRTCFTLHSIEMSSTVATQRQTVAHKRRKLIVSTAVTFFCVILVSYSYVDRNIYIRSLHFDGPRLLAVSVSDSDKMKQQTKIFSVIFFGCRSSWMGLRSLVLVMKTIIDRTTGINVFTVSKCKVRSATLQLARIQEINRWKCVMSRLGSSASETARDSVETEITECRVFYFRSTDRPNNKKLKKKWKTNSEMKWKNVHIKSAWNDSHNMLFSLIFWFASHFNLLLNRLVVYTPFTSHSNARIVNAKQIYI